MVIAEEAADQHSADTLHSAIILASHGETSASHNWPQDPRPPSTWDCRPTDLPRHWQLNRQVHFQAAAENGSALDRSFEPELLRPDLARDAGDKDEPWAGRSCAPNQLTSDGFKQAVRVGRQLAGRYGEALPQAALDVLSVDTKPSLATAVGILLPLLAGPASFSTVADGATVSITTRAGSETLVLLGGQAVAALEDAQSGSDILSRWCNHGTLPCAADACMTPKAAAELVADGEARLCQALSSSSLPIARYLEKAKNRHSGSFSILSVSGIDITATLVQLLGREACEDVLMARPPWSSVLVFVSGRL